MACARAIMDMEPDERMTPVTTVSPVTTVQIIGWSSLLVAWLGGTIGSQMSRHLNRSTRGALAVVGTLSILVLIVWGIVFAATVRCPVRCTREP